MNHKYTDLPLFREKFILRAQQTPDLVPLTFVSGRLLTETHYCYRELDQKAKKVARQLCAHKAFQQRIGLPAANNIDFVVGLLGCFYAGAIAVPIPIEQHGVSQSRGRYILNFARLFGMLSFPDSSGEPAARFDNIQQISVDFSLEAFDEAEIEFATINSEDLALIQFTSGTTGEPVGVCLSHRALVYNLMVIEEAIGHTVTDKRIGLNWCPFYHDMGLVGGLLNPLYMGLHIIQMQPYDFLKKPINWINLIHKYRVTSSGGPTFAYHLLLSAIYKNPHLIEGLNISCWDAAFCGAEPVNVMILEQFARLTESIGFKSQALLPCYGMAEFGLFISGAPFLTGLKSNSFKTPSEAYQIASCGIPYGDTHICIVDTDGKLQKEGEKGEIYIAGSSLLSGYWRNGALQNCYSYLDGDSRPYLATGDLGYLCEGELFITGRKKHIIKVNGVSLFPHLIIQEISTRLPRLDQIRGIIVQPDYRSSHLCIIHELIRGAKLSEEDLISLRNSAINHLISLTGTSDIELILVKSGSLPKTTSGKIVVPDSEDMLNHLKNKLSAFNI